jgi:UDP-N-acetylmuramyl pentapeptide synthase
MRYRLFDIPDLLRSPIGRFQLRASAYNTLWPVLRRFANLYRRTFARHTRVVTVVGSFGKTTTTRALVATLGTIRWHGEANALSNVAQAVFRIRPHDRHAVIEIGIEKPGEMAPYAHMIRPNITVVTSIGSEHNSSLGTLERTREEKAKMVRIVPPSGLVVLNGDDPNVRWMQGETKAQVVTFGFEKINDVWASDVSLEDWPKGTRFTLHAGGEARDFRIKMIGRPMVYPILAAVAVALTEGFTLDQIQPSLEALPPTPGRLEPVQLPNGAMILRDDYKSALETVEAAFDVLAEIPAKRRIVVLGQVTEPPGEQGPIYRHLGTRIGSFASKAIFICDRRDSACSAGATAVGMPRSAIVKTGRDLFKAIEALRGDLGPGDVVLIKGRITERLDRITLALMGRAVSCRIDFCKTRIVRCDHCSMLEHGWDQSRPVI